MTSLKKVYDPINVALALLHLAPTHLPVTLLLPVTILLQYVIIVC